MNLQDLMKHVRALEISARQNVTEVFAGNYKSSFRGRGMEYEDVREYTEGSDIRDIDWNITAREGKPYVKIYREERELSTFLIVDLSSSMNFGSRDYLKKDIALQVAAILTFSIQKNNDKIGLLAYSEGVETYIPPKKGNAHSLHILRMLLSGYQENFLKSSNLERALSFLHRVSKKRNVCFLITDEIPPNSEKLIALTNKRHDLVIIRISDPMEKSLPQSGVFWTQNPESGAMEEINFSSGSVKQKYRKLRREKEEAFQRILKKYAIDVIDLSTDSNIFQELFFFFRKRQKRF